jgi:hypothetical protein
MEMPQTHCHATVTVTLLWKCHKLIATQQQLSRYYGNATNSLPRYSNCHVTMEMPQTHCHATATVALLWKRHQGRNMSQYLRKFNYIAQLSIELCP